MNSPLKASSGLKVRGPMENSRQASRWAKRGTPTEASGLRGFPGEGADGFDARLLGRVHHAHNLSEGGFFVRAQGELEQRIFGGGGGQFTFQSVWSDGHGVVPHAQRA